MQAADQRLSRGDTIRIAKEIYEARIRPKLPPEDEHKYIAIDALTGEYEVDANGAEAILRLEAREPAARIYLGRIGHPTTYRM